MNEFRAAVRLRADSAEAHLNLGLTLDRKNDLDGAVSQLREALRLNPDYAAAHWNLGNQLVKKGDYRGAVEQFHAAAQLEPDNALYRGSYNRAARELKP